MKHTCSNIEKSPECDDTQLGHPGASKTVLFRTTEVVESDDCSSDQSGTSSQTVLLRTNCVGDGDREGGREGSNKGKGKRGRGNGEYRGRKCRKEGGTGKFKQKWSKEEIRVAWEC